MVKLSFQVTINGSLPEVWNYYSNFQNIVDWDPNTTYCKRVKSTPHHVGSEFLLKSLFNGNQSTLTYTITKFQSGDKKCLIKLKGINDNVECIDEITFTSKDSQTIMDYKADICLRGIKVLFTPFIMSALDKIAEDCKEGVVRINNEKWGTRQ